MEANRWYMCIRHYSIEFETVFKFGRIYFFEEEREDWIYTIDERGERRFFLNDSGRLESRIFRIATNEEIHNPNQVVFKEKVSVESQVLTKREQFAMAAMQAIVYNPCYLVLTSDQINTGVPQLSIKLSDALIKALNESKS